MNFAQESSLHPSATQLPGSELNLTPSSFPSYLLIQERAAQIILIHRPYPHFSLNPLSGNSLY